MSRTKQDILTGYEKKARRQQEEIEVLKSKLNKIAFSRLGLFILEILIVALIISEGYFWIFGVLALIPVILFLIQVKKQSAVQSELEYAVKLLWVYQNEIAHVTGGKNGYSSGEAYLDELHRYASDLDIYGQGSLFSHINRCNTENGLGLLAESLGNAKDKVTIAERQTAITELGSYIEQSFHFRAQLQGHQPAQLRTIQHKLVNQLPAQLGFTSSKFLRMYVKFIPFLMTGLLLAGIVFGGLLWKILTLAALVNAGFTFFYLSDTNKVYYGFTGGSNLLSAFAGTIKWTEEIEWKSEYIRRMFNGELISLQIRQLSSIIQAFDARLNIFVSAFLNLFFLWDLRCSVQLADWHSRSSVHLIAGLYRISQFEELISFATLSHNEPDWNFPVIEDTFRFNGTGIGHPLIRESARVLNDFDLPDRPTVDIITGSNMAGKSTFLRTVGINMVLAFAGAPVCAKSLSLSLFNVLSYMRIKDSLNDQTSTFKAELIRLKMILDTTGTSANAFVLIDEMLRGTNSRDKYLGSKVFIEKLIAQGTPALFATHDLQLSEMQADHQEKVRNYHFDIQISGGEMEFDYKLKQGPCKTFNAALLLKQIGLTLS